MTPAKKAHDAPKVKMVESKHVEPTWTHVGDAVANILKNIKVNQVKR